MWTMFYNICTRENLFRKGIIVKISLLFTIIYPKIDMNVVKAIFLGNNLLMHIRENTDFHLAVAEC